MVHWRKGASARNGESLWARRAQRAATDAEALLLDLLQIPDLLELRGGERSKVAQIRMPVVRQKIPAIVHAALHVVLKPLDVLAVTLQQLPQDQILLVLEDVPRLWVSEAWVANFIVVIVRVVVEGVSGPAEVLLEDVGGGEGGALLRIQPVSSAQ